MLTPFSLVMLSVIALIVIYMVIVEVKRTLTDKLEQRNRRKTREICQKRAHEKWEQAFSEFTDWQNLHPVPSSIDPEYQRLVENLLRAFRKTLRYKDQISERDLNEVERLRDLLPFRTNEFID